MIPPKPRLDMDGPDGTAGAGAGPTQSETFNSLANGSAIPWAEIFSRHESVLNTHLEMLDSVKDHVAPDGEAFRTVSSMLNKTVQAMNQFKVVRKHMLSKKASEGASTFAPASSFKMNAHPTSTSQSNEAEITRKKRSRTENEENATFPSAQTKSQAFPTDEVRASKRKRDTGSYAGMDDDQHTASAATETEDISEEVQRRLELREERRRKKGSAQTEKRKRASPQSNESESPDTSRRRKKRARTGIELENGEMMSRSQSERTKKG